MAAPNDSGSPSAGPAGNLEQTRARLEASEAELRAVVECAVDGIIVIDAQGRIEAFNPAAERLFGYSVAEVMGQNVRLLMPEPYRSGHDQYVANYLHSGVRKVIGIGREVTGRRRDGSTFPMDLAVNEMRVGEQRKFAGLVRDISERKRQIEALRQAQQSEARFRIMVESVQDYAIMLLDRDGCVSSWNAGAERIYGYAGAQVLGFPGSAFCTAEDVAAGMPERRLLLAQQHGYHEDEGWRVRSGGTRFWASVTLTALRDESGGVTGYAKVTRDLTERKRAEAELSDRETRLRTLVETSADGIVVINSQGRIESFNAAAERLFGYTAEESRGRNIAMLVPPPGSDNTAASPYGATSLRDLGGRSEGCHKDGGRFPVEITLSRMTIAGEQQFTAFIRDISQRKRAEQELSGLNRSLSLQVTETRAALLQLRETQRELVQKEKLASLGSMVAGVAHEINTPVGVGVTAASTLFERVQLVQRQAAARELSRGEFERFLQDAAQAAELLLNNLQRAARLVKSFKEVAVDQTSGERRQFELGGYAADVLASLRPWLRNRPCAVELECRDEVWLDSYPGAIAQIVTNLVGNSLLHAFPDERKGTLRLVIGAEQDSVRMSYSDDGVGIPAENLPQIFDPFFTTRRGTGGSGLGLYVVYNLVTQMLRGKIGVTSAPGSGVSFTISFPRVVDGA
ncbi:MAG: PAS domain S-box protein [Nevskia sp.]|nr:PAS domain S-box protein [Nevskia sp.]